MMRFSDINEKTAHVLSVDSLLRVSADDVELQKDVTYCRISNKTYHAGNLISDPIPLKTLLMEGGHIDMTGTTPAYRFYVTDYQGNIRLLTDASGTALQVNHYDPFGNELDMNAQSSPIGDAPVLSGSDTVNPYKYSGKEWDSQASLYDFSARVYNPTLHRFTTMDPLAEKYYSISPYAYCAGNPVNLVDPSGEQWYYCTDENGHSTYEYYEGEMPDEEKKKYQSIEDKGYTFDDGIIYYSLFGKKMPLSDENGASLNTQIHMKVDKMIITFVTNPLDADGQLFRRENMAIDGYEKGGWGFSYQGRTFNSIHGVGPGHSNVGDGSVFFTKKPEDASTYICSFPYDEYPLPSGPQKGFEKGYWMRAVNGKGVGDGQDIFRIKFDRKNAMSFINSVNYLFNKHYTIK